MVTAAKVWVPPPPADIPDKLRIELLHMFTLPPDTVRLLVITAADMFAVPVV